MVLHVEIRMKFTYFVIFDVDMFTSLLLLVLLRQEGENGRNLNRILNS